MKHKKEKHITLRKTCTIKPPEKCYYDKNADVMAKKDSRQVKCYNCKVFDPHNVDSGHKMRDEL